LRVTYSQSCVAAVTNEVHITIGTDYTFSNKTRFVTTPFHLFYSYWYHPPFHPFTTPLKKVNSRTYGGLKCARRCRTDGRTIELDTASWLVQLTHNGTRLKKSFLSRISELKPISVAVRSKAWVIGRSLTGIAGSNPTGGMDVCVCRKDGSMERKVT
jgi:hypothetical protein